MDKTKIVFGSKFQNFEKLNDEFTLAECYVCAAGKNRNGSSISQETINDALPSLWNVPVIAHLYEDADGKLTVGGHDMTLAKDADGNLLFKSLCVPYGVVPERPDLVEFVDVDEGGARGVKTYLKAPVILWTGRFPEIAEAYSSDGDKLYDQSMEINVTDSKPCDDDPNYTDITSFSFSALTLLGDGVEPCFPEAKVVESFAFDEEKFSQLFAELKTELSTTFSEGKGETMEDTENKTPEMEPETEPAAEPKTEPAAEPIPEPEKPEEEHSAEPAAPNKYAAFAATYREKLTALEAMFKDEPILDDEGNEIGFIWWYVCDFDDEYAYVEKHTCREEGCTDQHFKAPYKFDEETMSASAAGDFVEVFARWLTQEEIDQLEKLKADYQELVDYKCGKEEDERKACCDAVIDEFADMAGNEEYDNIVANRYGYANVDELRNACYIVRGKFSMPAPAHKPAEVAVPVAPAVERVLTAREKLHEAFGRK